jgi:pimeloyl-ACP methyl ester carboxylesterase
MKGWITILLLFILYIGVVFYTVNYSKLFKPSKKIVDFIQSPTEETMLDGISVARFENNPMSSTILFCHGNSGNVTNRNYMIRLCKMVDLNLVLFDYSGYGRSEGTPRTRKILKDGKKVLNWTLLRVPEDKLIIWGESLGGSIASYLASKKKCSKLILFATFASLNHLAFGKDNKTWWKLPIQSLLNIFIHPLPTKHWLTKSIVPTLIVHSRDDELISVQHARMMKNIDPRRINLLEIQGGHGTPKVCKSDLDVIMSFCGVQNFVNHDVCLNIFDNVGKEIWVE